MKSVTHVKLLYSQVIRDAEFHNGCQKIKARVGPSTVESAAQISLLYGLKDASEMARLVESWSILLLTTKRILSIKI